MAEPAENPTRGPARPSEGTFALRAIDSADRMAQSLSPWVREMLDAGNAPAAGGSLVHRLMRRRADESISFRSTLSILKRFHRIATRTTAWKADVGTISPGLFEQFSDVMFKNWEMGANNISALLKINRQEEAIEMPLAGEVGGPAPAQTRQAANPALAMTMEEIRRRVEEARKFESMSPSALPNFVKNQDSAQHEVRPVAQRPGNRPTPAPPRPTDQPLARTLPGQTPPAPAPAQPPASQPAPRMMRRRMARQVEYLSMPASESESGEAGSGDDSDAGPAVHFDTGPPGLDWFFPEPQESGPDWFAAVADEPLLVVRPAQTPSRPSSRPFVTPRRISAPALAPAPIARPARTSLRRVPTSPAQPKAQPTRRAGVPRRAGVVQRAMDRLAQSASGQLLASRPYLLLDHIQRQSSAPAQQSQRGEPASNLQPSAALAELLPAEFLDVLPPTTVDTAPSRRIPGDVAPALLSVSLEDFALAYPRRLLQRSEVLATDPVMAVSPGLPAADGTPISAPAQRSERIQEGATTPQGEITRRSALTPPRPRPLQRPATPGRAGGTGVQPVRLAPLLPASLRAPSHREQAAPRSFRRNSLAALQARPLRTPPTVMRFLVAPPISAPVSGPESDARPELFRPASPASQPSPQSSPTEAIPTGDTLPALDGDDPRLLPEIRHDFEPVSGLWRSALLRSLPGLAPQPAAQLQAGEESLQRLALPSPEERADSAPIRIANVSMPSLDLAVARFHRVAAAAYPTGPGVEPATPTAQRRPVATVRGPGLGRAQPRPTPAPASPATLPVSPVLVGRPSVDRPPAGRLSSPRPVTGLPEPATVEGKRAERTLVERIAQRDFAGSRRDILTTGLLALEEQPRPIEQTPAEVQPRFVEEPRTQAQTAFSPSVVPSRLAAATGQSIRRVGLAAEQESVDVGRLVLAPRQTEAGERVRAQAVAPATRSVPSASVVVPARAAPRAASRLSAWGNESLLLSPRAQTRTLLQRAAATDSWQKDSSTRLEQRPQGLRPSVLRPPVLLVDTPLVTSVLPVAPSIAQRSATQPTAASIVQPSSAPPVGRERPSDPAVDRPELSSTAPVARPVAQPSSALPAASERPSGPVIDASELSSASSVARSVAQPSSTPSTGRERPSGPVVDTSEFSSASPVTQPTSAPPVGRERPSDPVAGAPELLSAVPVAQSTAQPSSAPPVGRERPSDPVVDRPELSSTAPVALSIAQLTSAPPVGRERAVDPVAGASELSSAVPVASSITQSDPTLPAESERRLPQGVASFSAVLPAFTQLSRIPIRLGETAAAAQRLSVPRTGLEPVSRLWRSAWLEGENAFSTSTENLELPFDWAVDLGHGQSDEQAGGTSPMLGSSLGMTGGELPLAGTFLSVARSLAPDLAPAQAHIAQPDLAPVGGAAGGDARVDRLSVGRNRVQREADGRQRPLSGTLAPANGPARSPTSAQARIAQPARSPTDGAVGGEVLVDRLSAGRNPAQREADGRQRPLSGTPVPANGPTRSPARPVGEAPRGVFPRPRLRGELPAERPAAVASRPVWPVAVSALSAVAPAGGTEPTLLERVIQRRQFGHLPGYLPGRSLSDQPLPGTAAPAVAALAVVPRLGERRGEDQLPSRLLQRNHRPGQTGQDALQWSRRRQWASALAPVSAAWEAQPSSPEDRQAVSARSVATRSGDGGARFSRLQSAPISTPDAARDFYFPPTLSAAPSPLLTSSDSTPTDELPLRALPAGQANHPPLGMESGGVARAFSDGAAQPVPTGQLTAPPRGKSPRVRPLSRQLLRRDFANTRADGLGSGEWGAGSGEWGVGSGERRLGSGDWGPTTGDRGLGTDDRRLRPSGRGAALTRTLLQLTRQPAHGFGLPRDRGTAVGGGVSQPSAFSAVLSIPELATERRVAFPGVGAAPDAGVASGEPAPGPGVGPIEPRGRAATERPLILRRLALPGDPTSGAVQLTQSATNISGAGAGILAPGSVGRAAAAQSATRVSEAGVGILVPGSVGRAAAAQSAAQVVRRRMEPVSYLWRVALLSDAPEMPRLVGRDRAGPVSLSGDALLAPGGLEASDGASILPRGMQNTLAEPQETARREAAAQRTTNVYEVDLFAVRGSVQRADSRPASQPLAQAAFAPLELALNRLLARPQPAGVATPPAGEQAVSSRPAGERPAALARIGATPPAAQAAQRLESAGWRFKRSSTPSAASTGAVQRALTGLAEGRSRALPPRPRTLMERILQRDFAGVRVQMASLGPLGIEAAARGNTVYLSREQTRLDRPESLALLGHELTHIAAGGAAPLLARATDQPISGGIAGEEGEAELPLARPLAPSLSQRLSRQLVQMSLAEEESTAAAVEAAVRRGFAPGNGPGAAAALIRRRSLAATSPRRQPDRGAPAPSASIDEGSRSVERLAQRRLATSRFEPVSQSWPAQDFASAQNFAPAQGSAAPLELLEDEGWRFKRSEQPSAAQSVEVQRASAELTARPSGGMPLPARPRTLMERVLQRDFSGVRLQAAGLEALGVEAAARGQTVYLQRSALAQLDRPDNLALLGHELTHVAVGTNPPVRRSERMAQTPAGAESAGVLPLSVALPSIGQLRGSVQREETAAAQVEHGIHALLKQGSVQREPLALRPGNGPVKPMSAGGAGGNGNGISRGGAQGGFALSTSGDLPVVQRRAVLGHSLAALSAPSGGEEAQRAQVEGPVLDGVSTEAMPVVQRFLERPSLGQNGLPGGAPGQAGPQTAVAPAALSNRATTHYPLQRSLPQPAQQRVQQNVDDNGDEGENENQEPDWDRLAEKIYPLIRRMIEMERERRPL